MKQHFPSNNIKQYLLIKSLINYNEDDKKQYITVFILKCISQEYNHTTTQSGKHHWQTSKLEELETFPAL